jgi:hypothetical protein
MPYSAVEHLAFRYRDPDHDVPDCSRLTNGLWADDKSHCARCANLIRACKPRPYQVWDYLGRPIVSTSVEPL